MILEITVDKHPIMSKRNYLLFGQKPTRYVEFTLYRNDVCGLPIIKGKGDFSHQVRDFLIYNLDGEVLSIFFDKFIVKKLIYCF
jgi:hypothetical protein